MGYSIQMPTLDNFLIGYPINLDSNPTSEILLIPILDYNVIT